MTRRLLVLLVLRVVGIVLLAEVAVGFIQTLGFLSYLGTTGISATDVGWGVIGLQVTVFTAITGSIALACLVNADWLARRLFPEFDDSEVSISHEVLGPLAFRVLGAATLLWATPGAVTAALEVLWNLGGERRAVFAAAFAERWSEYVASVVAAITGWIVFSRSESLARLRPSPGARR